MPLERRRGPRRSTRRCQCDCASQKGRSSSFLGGRSFRSSRHPCTASGCCRHWRRKVVLASDGVVLLPEVERLSLIEARADVEGVACSMAKKSWSNRGRRRRRREREQQRRASSAGNVGRFLEKPGAKVRGSGAATERKKRNSAVEFFDPKKCTLPCTFLIRA